MQAVQSAHCMLGDRPSTLARQPPVHPADRQRQLVEAAARLAREAANEAAAFSGGRSVLVAGVGSASPSC